MEESIKQNNFIGGMFLDDLSICDRLIDYYEQEKEREIEGTSFRGVDHSVKKCKEIFFSYDEPIMYEYSHIHLQKVCNEYIKKYEFCISGSHFSVGENIKIQKYCPQDGYFSWHYERDSCRHPVNNRHLVFLTYLNDVLEGGETEFYYQNLKVKPQKGLTLIWPVDWTHTHRGNPSPTESKYIITGWYYYI